MASAKSWIDRLQLQPHVEGGWYREAYRSPLTLDAQLISPHSSGQRSACTHIYFLLEEGNFSAFHRIRCDELWHFYDGDPVTIYEIDNDGKLTEHRLGRDHPFCVIHAGNWFASKVAAGGTFGLVGCSVAPGFDFADFELARREELAEQYPEHRELIVLMCRE